MLLIGSSEPPTWQIRPSAQHTHVMSIEQWTSAFLVFASIYVVQHPDQARQLLKYADTVRSAAFHRTGCGWHDYNIQFCLRQARLPSHSWASIDAELRLKSMHELQTVFHQKINREIQMGRVAGPYTNPPLPNLHCSPVRLLPKQTPGEFCFDT